MGDLRRRSALLGGASTLLVAALAALVLSGGGGAGSGMASGNATDRQFVSRMASHHERDLAVGKFVSQRAAHGQLRRLVSQNQALRGELAVLGAIRRDMQAMGERRLAVPAPRGVTWPDGTQPFDRAMIDMLVRRAQDAIAIARPELAGGTQPALRKMAGVIIADQRREIARMLHWRTRWYVPGTGDGFMLKLGSAELPARRGLPFWFAIAGPDGRRLRSFAVSGTTRMHLIVLRRDLAGFQHVHPAMGPNGIWTASLDLSRPGPYRAYALFRAAGADRIVSAALRVAGTYVPKPEPRPRAVVGAGGGYRVSMSRGARSGRLTFRVFRGGRALSRLAWFQGGRGQLVVVRGTELAHVQADNGQAGPGKTVRFDAGLSSPGRYHLFLVFRAGGAVRTAAYTVTVG